MKKKSNLSNTVGLMFFVLVVLLVVVFLLAGLAGLITAVVGALAGSLFGGLMVLQSVSEGEVTATMLDDAEKGKRKK